MTLDRDYRGRRRQKAVAERVRKIKEAQDPACAAPRAGAGGDRCCPR